MNVDKIRAVCRERNMSITDFERDAGLSNGTVGKWETMKYSPRYDLLKKAADFLGITVDELMECSGQT